ncbi:MAG: hypothetical protein U0031_23620, partial [Thermomicrobiales bacterium]
RSVGCDACVARMLDHAVTGSGAIVKLPVQQTAGVAEEGHRRRGRATLCYASAARSAVNSMTCQMSGIP